ncbi:MULTISPECIES: ribonuclease III [unclassified Synechocystis]|uniref:ribonuclease III n=1 Tax=unclassified Synechocystis TaxID=2640012 RepID=UPI0003F8FDCA|nr:MULTISPECIES: ribonuclease III [unclassified Synechocystis]AIE75589.1 Ribonuclease III [Synechocystis sp. PCC 6714]MCT0253789.1 ribonuclease III [Synechocystis sp. CS-94]
MSLAPHRQTQLKALLRRLGLADNVGVDLALLDLALTHGSQSPEKNYQQLEFVGDAVVRLAAAEVLMENYPQASVGEMSALRAILVSDRTLADWGELYGLDRFLWVTPAVLADKNGRVSLMADSFEALLGALYLSVGDLSLVHPWLGEHLRKKAVEISQDPALHNYKEALQAWTQANYKCLPEYRVESLAQNSSQQLGFQATVWLGDQPLGSGSGPSKKSAEQAAAHQAYQEFIAKEILPIPKPN